MTDASKKDHNGKDEDATVQPDSMNPHAEPKSMNPHAEPKSMNPHTEPETDESEK
jgi:hypothetical protein